LRAILAIKETEYQKLLRRHGFNLSMSGKGNCYDNYAVGSFLKSLKAELVCDEADHGRNVGRIGP
jgi:transposase InsO family protein